MNIAFYSGVTGLQAQMEGMNIYSNNIANVNTVGFKPLRPSFAECLYTLQHPVSDGRELSENTAANWETGHGVYIAKTDLMWEQSQFVASDQPLDCALPNDDFFMVKDRRGDTYLTRDGSFTITDVGDHWELVNGMGEFVMDYDGNNITVPFENDKNGNPTSIIDYDALYAQIGVYAVDNNWGLDQKDNNHFAVTPRSGEPAADRDADKVAMYLEMSGTNIASEMVHIIETQRAYQLNAKIIQAADEFMSIANNLRQ